MRRYNKNIDSNYINYKSKVFILINFLIAFVKLIESCLFFAVPHRNRKLIYLYLCKYYTQHLKQSTKQLTINSIFLNGSKIVLYCVVEIYQLLRIIIAYLTITSCKLNRSHVLKSTQRTYYEWYTYQRTVEELFRTIPSSEDTTDSCHLLYLDCYNIEIALLPTCTAAFW